MSTNTVVANATDTTTSRQLHTRGKDTVLRCERTPGPTVWLLPVSDKFRAVWTNNGAFCDCRTITQPVASEILEISDTIDLDEDPKGRIMTAICEGER